MKKVLLFVFLIAFAVVNAKTYQVSTSLSPPSSSIVKDCATTLMSQVFIVKTLQIDVGLFERDASYSVSSENYQSVISRRLPVPCAVNFQVLVNQNCASVFLGKSDVLLPAMSPQCRAVLRKFSCDAKLMTWIATQTLNQASSPNCRDVSFVS